MDELISLADLAEARSGPNPPVLIDVRSAEDYHSGHIPGARHIPVDDVLASLDEIRRDRPVVTY